MGSPVPRTTRTKTAIARHVVWLSIDTYDAHGRLIGSLLGARSLLSPEGPHDVLDDVLASLPPEYRQLSGDEVRELLEQRAPAEHRTWEQLSIF